MTATPNSSPLTDGPVTLHPREPGQFSIVVGGSEVGRASVTQPETPRVARLWCELAEQHRGRGYARRAVGLLVTYAVEQLGVDRIEGLVDAGDRRAMRLAAQAGLRREGLLRGHGTGSDGQPRDVLLMARLAHDPPVGSGEMFRATLNASLPLKRTISQGLVRNQHGQVLLCELVYKRFWDLPGGVVDPGESPASAVVREVAEELQVRVDVRSLAVISWLPPWRGWDDAMLYLFDLAVAGVDCDVEAVIAGAVLEPREIRAVHWADPVTVRERCAPYTARLIEQAVRLTDAGDPTAYLEDGIAPSW